jgi:GR25 family glycosyltransferase involved in LPS biosynthesis
MLNNLLKSFLEKRDLEIGRKIVNLCVSDNMFSIGVVIGNYILEIFNDIEIIVGVAKCCYNSGDYKLCYELYDKVLSMDTLDENTSKSILDSQYHCISHISDLYSCNPCTKIIKKSLNEFPMVTFTITTCKRYDLFEKTMNSFLTCCLDVDRIDKWLCVDDNSSDEDREKMGKNYPFFEFYFKNKSEKGHPQSMNIIRNKVTTPYIFHCEDDWKFFAKRNYITDCLQIINDDSKIGQCLINKNYTEVENIKIVGGIYKTVSAGVCWGEGMCSRVGGKRYYIHEYCSTPQEYEVFNRKYNGLSNCAYWPYFSFRPSLLKTDILKSIGEFNETISHFEMEYSNRYKNSGYVSAFLEGIYCLHTGRLTSERFDQTRSNAYILNDEKQFGDKEHRSLDLNIKTYIINLDRRKDRWEKFQTYKEVKCLDYKRFPAIDGTTLEPTESLQRIFDGNDYNMREGMVGCAMSHIKLYIELVNSEYDAFCIMEDDLEFVPNFREKFQYLYKNLPQSWDMCYLGHHMWKKYKTDEYYDKTCLPISEKWDTCTSLKYSMGGTGGYIISKKGAEKLLEFINLTGMTNGIDTMQQKAADTLNIYYPKPHLIYSECCTVEVKTDTDIQYNYRSLSIPLENRLVEEEKFFGKVIKTDVEPDFENLKDIIFYTGSNIRDVLKRCSKPCYVLDYKVLVIVPAPEICVWFERLRGQDKKWNIDNAVKIREKTSIISFGGAHVYDGIKSFCFDTCEYPFDTMYGGDLEVFTLLTEMTIKMDDQELYMFVNDLCSISKNTTYLQTYNNKIVLKNDRYKIAFPHEDVDKLLGIYTAKFKNLRDIIMGQKKVKLVYCTRWETSPIRSFYYLIDMLRKYNENVCVYVINAIGKDEEIDAKYKGFLEKDYIMFQENFQDDKWEDHQKINYDQTIFKTKVIGKIKKILG